MNRRTLLIAGGAAMAVLVLWYVLLWSPRKSELSDAKEQREAAETERDQLATRVERLKASQKDEPLKRAQVEALRTTVPDEPRLAAFILDTNDAAAKAGIDFISIAPSEPAPGTPVVASAGVASAQPGTGAPATAAALPAEIKLQLQITGGYFQVLDFLNRVNDMPRLVVTDGLSVTADDKAKLSVSLTARMFVRAVPPGYGDVPATAVTVPVPAPATATAASTTASTVPPSTATAAPAAGPTPTGAQS